VKALNRWQNNVGYCYGIETVTNKDQVKKEMTEFFCDVRKIQDGSDYTPSSLKVLNGKMKVLKQSRKTTKHHDPLSPNELRTIFNHEALSINTAKGIQFTKFSQKNDPGSIEGNLDSFIIPVLADPEGYLGPVHNIKLYLSKRPTNCACQFLHLKINKNIHGIPIVTLMSITSHKSESSYHIYSRPSEQQKKDALSTLIDVVDLPESQNNKDNDVDNSLNKNQDSPNLPLHVNATKKNPTLGGKRLLWSSQSGLQNASNNG
ncbi:8575_t:CDS:2, partial [Cetraspora pellucida]